MCFEADLQASRSGQRHRAAEEFGALLFAPGIAATEAGDKPGLKRQALLQLGGKTAEVVLQAGMSFRYIRAGRRYLCDVIDTRLVQQDLQLQGFSLVRWCRPLKAIKTCLYYLLDSRFKAAGMAP